MLTTQDRDELIARAKQGDEEAFETLIKAHEAALIVHARSWWAKGSDYDDILQETRIAFWKAVRSFDMESGQGLPWAKFLSMVIRRHMRTFLQNAHRKKRSLLNDALRLDMPAYNPLPGEDPRMLGDTLADEGAPDPSQVCVHRDVIRRTTREIKARFSELEYGVWLGSLNDLNYTEMSERLGVHTKAIDNATQRVRRKLVGIAEFVGEGIA